MLSVKNPEEEMWSEFEKLQNEIYSLLSEDESYGLADTYDHRFESLKAKVGSLMTQAKIDKMPKKRNTI